MSSANIPAVAMDVDSTSNGPLTLKRCSSAPMINENNSVMNVVPPVNSSNREPVLNLFGTSQTRTRRFSASFSPVPGSPVSGLRLTPRINQLRQEEHADISNSRELAHEREIQHTFQISQSWEDLSLMGESQSDQKTKMGPLHVNLGSFNFNCSSSPTRICSPNFQSPTRGSRTLIRRSASPVLKPSPLGVKRKLDDDKLEYYQSPKKRSFSQNFLSNDRGGLLTTTSSSLPGSLSSAGTPESYSSADSPNFNFRNVDSPSPSRPMNVENNVEPMVVSKGDQEMNETPS